MNAEQRQTVGATYFNVELYPLYQPIVSITKGRAMGYESLIRGDGPGGVALLPAEIFDIARKTDTTLELDRQCRELALNGFVASGAAGVGYSLFINIDTSILEKSEGSNYLYNQVMDSGLSPENVVIEICESKANDTEKLLNFVSRYKKEGFLIALDDLGTGFSNLERIPILQPDIVKLDRSLIKDSETDAYKRECLKSLVRLANSIGAVTVAEGVETETEAYAALESGAHLLQGYYFARPGMLAPGEMNCVEECIRNISIGFKKHMKRKIREDRASKKRHETELGALLENLKNCNSTQYDEVMRGFSQSPGSSRIECVFILNEQGRQISDTVFSKGCQDNRKRLLFCPTTVDADHSLKEYYYRLANSRLSKYYSEPYISMATGNVCVTLTVSFRDIDNNSRILCVDYKY